VLCVVLCGVLCVVLCVVCCMCIVLCVVCCVLCVVCYIVFVGVKYVKVNVNTTQLLYVCPPPLLMENLNEKELLQMTLQFNSLGIRPSVLNDNIINRENCIKNQMRGQVESLSYTKHIQMHKH
jgi:hypothetical protein